jgi:hypothetical protein
LARRLEGTHRDYSDASEWEICGTADLVVPGDHANGNVPTVVDWKSAVWDLDLDASRFQLSFYALCVASLMGATEVRCGIGEIDRDGGVSRWATTDSRVSGSISGSLPLIVLAI